MLGKNWHNLSITEVENILDSNSKNGLSQDQILLREKKYGKNVIEKEKSASKFEILIEQFKTPLIYILIIAGIVTLLLKEYSDSIVIFISVFLNTIVGYIQENKSSKALAKLKSVLSLNAIVLRDNRKMEINAENIVPGDIVFLEEGDKVPADGRVIESNNLKINEVVLTGEWIPASKHTNILEEETPLADRDNMAYMGTIVEDGGGKMIVTSIGMNTEIGRITRLVKETKEEQTPYQKKIATFSKLIGKIVLIICFIIFIEGILTGGSFIEIFTISVAIAVSSIPEGLPMAMTIILAIGMQRILERKGLVRKLAAAETLGSISVIAVDKTGTLTEAKMKVAGIYSFNNVNSNYIIYKAAILCSKAFIENIDDINKDWIIRGEATEKAILEKAANMGIFKHELEKQEDQIDEIPFDSKYKYSASLRIDKNNNKTLYFKGAPEVIFEKSKYVLDEGNKIVELNKDYMDLLNKEYEELTQEGYRVLAVAYKNTSINRIDKNEHDLVFIGLIYLEDPIRESAKDAIKECYKAGIRPIIVTGDYSLTAKSIANKIGLNVVDGEILEGKDLDKMSDFELKQQVGKYKIYARVTPEHKLKIVKAWQQKGEVIAMTGDGINDSPALKQADIGVALGSGTEVAKEVADLVLLSDDFSVIVAAVEEGRAIIDNIRKVITYLLSDSLTEMILISGSVLFGFPMPVTAVQILWVNLIEDGFPNIALAFEPKEDNLMNEKPQKKDSPLLTKEMRMIIFIIGILTDLMLLGIFLWLDKKDTNIDHVRTIIFASLAVDSLFYVFSCKSLKKNLWEINILNNKLIILSWFIGIVGLLIAIYIPFFNNLLNTIPLDFNSWILVFIVGLINLILIEAAKYYFIRRKKEK